MTDTTTIKLTSVQEDYLAIIYKEECETGQARGCSIADSAGVTRATVATTLRALKAKGLVSYAPYGPIVMTEEGRALAQKLTKKRDVLQRFFEDVMSLEKETAQKLASELEHVVDQKIAQRFERFNDFFAVHGFGFADKE
ncbi:MAG: metal-dependent transcriptional regulator [Sutterellaceae bacterium]|nr:metal-dependent transcriptional regulator [Sutterellaceae bacterium]